MRPLWVMGNSGLLIRGCLVVNKLNRRNWILSPLLSATFVLSFFFSTTNAALLKDIRIGEYQKFIRIVFEFNTPVEPDSIDLISADQLTVAFPHTAVDFIRKIPVEKSHHIKNIRIIDQSNHLSATINFDFRYLRHESFQLNNPPRVVLDIQPQAATGKSVKGTVATDHDGSGAEPEKTIADDSTVTSSMDKAPEDSILVQDINQAEVESLKNHETTANGSGNDLPVSPPTRANADRQKQDTDVNQTITLDSTPQAPVGKTNRLQFYLVIVLVLITIAILVLLLLMLLSRHHWAADRTQLKPKEFLKNQDRHLASLDARIKEQIKRYEEA